MKDSESPILFSTSTTYARYLVVNYKNYYTFSFKCYLKPFEVPVIFTKTSEY